MLSRHPGTQTELKTSKFINGRGAWRQVTAEERKEFLAEVCRLSVAQGSRIFGIALSVDRFSTAVSSGFESPFVRPDYWLASAMFTVSLVQEKMQGQKKNKGHTVVVMDDNKRHMPALSNAIYQANPWFDGLYQVRKTKRGKRFWEPRNVTNRFDQIINSPFAIKSNHSSFVQIADAIAYVYRRHFELMAIEESWSGERQYVAELAQVLEAGRETIILDRKVRQLREHPFEARSLLRSPSEPGDQSSWASSSSMGSSPGQAPQSTMGST